MYNIDESLGKMPSDAEGLPCAAHLIVGRKRRLGNENLKSDF